MSTDIIRFKANGRTSDKIFQLQALQIYLAISIPLVVITLLFAYGFHFWATRTEDGHSKRDPEKAD